MNAERFVKPGDARVYRVHGVLFADKNQPPDAMCDEMICSDISGAAIVDSDEIVGRTLGKRQIASVEKHEGDLCAIQGAGDAAVGRVLVGDEFQGREENACNALRDERPHHLFGGLSTVLHRDRRVAPEKRIGASELRPHHSVADRFEYLGQTEFGNEQSEGAAAGLVLGENVRAGAGPPRDQAHPLKVVNGLGNGDAGGVEELAKFGFAGETIAGFQRAALDAGEQVVKDTAVFGYTICRIAFRRRRQIAGGFSGFWHEDLTAVRCFDR
jgi:hypothetical protein